MLCQATVHRFSGCQECVNARDLAKVVFKSSLNRCHKGARSASNNGEITFWHPYTTHMAPATQGSLIHNLRNLITSTCSCMNISCTINTWNPQSIHYTDMIYKTTEPQNHWNHLLPYTFLTWVQLIQICMPINEYELPKT